MSAVLKRHATPNPPCFLAPQYMPRQVAERIAARRKSDASKPPALSTTTPRRRRRSTVSRRTVGKTPLVEDASQAVARETTVARQVLPMQVMDTGAKAGPLTQSKKSSESGADQWFKRAWQQLHAEGRIENPEPPNPVVPEDEQYQRDLTKVRELHEMWFQHLVARSLEEDNAKRQATLALLSSSSDSGFGGSSLIDTSRFTSEIREASGIPSMAKLRTRVRIRRSLVEHFLGADNRSVLFLREEDMLIPKLNSPGEHGSFYVRHAQFQSRIRRMHEPLRDSLAFEHHRPSQAQPFSLFVHRGAEWVTYFGTYRFVQTWDWMPLPIWLSLDEEVKQDVLRSWHASDPTRNWRARLDVGQSGITLAVLQNMGYDELLGTAFVFLAQGRSVLWKRE
ncbi:hypothetical protein PUNSTDRAFT_133280 [Punctularia strigosozonata HHB-11173 SS5]|uniref:uncharacterized protein n=1 Tax=Punctularia strigosozonata (strain HHB-11173) TaxID=741275 RepID=UPI000441625C|nr:uncharacterized protein PUNSTDRAFT_133280 [Punctularia strigosozonata HHB-11173 SS5]EIN09487.1 hypothetical protein PUNSTDRAFT_133280 [Punctularia strigosozonata HHB-11173 SS5]